MRQFSITAAIAIAVLGFVSLGTAQSQVIVTSGYQQGYYGGYSPYGGGVILQTGGTGYQYGSSYGYSSYPSYGYSPYSSYGYPAYSGYTSYSPALSEYYSFYGRGNAMYGRGNPGYGRNYGGRRGR